MTPLIRQPSEMQVIADALRREGKRIGAVLTMGALHDGHLSLIRLGRSRADVVVTTVFVNPTQFGLDEDFERYPRDLDKDRALAASAGSNFVFAPEVADMFPPEFSTYVSVQEMTGTLEGKSRPGHFQGVTTVVAKLFHLVTPHMAVFGQKDAQQVAVIRRMVYDLNFDIDILVGPTVREPDGLALSSRNAYLSAEERQQAPVLFQALQQAEQRIHQGGNSAGDIIDEMRELIVSRSDGVVDYISIADPDSLEELPTLTGRQNILVSLAVRFGTTRLIDNIMIRR